MPGPSLLSPLSVPRAVLFTALCGAACGAWADPSPALDRASISVGGFYADPRIQLGADTQYGRVDTPDHDLNRTTLPRVRAEMLIGDRQGLSFDYYRYDKNYTPDLSGSTVVGGVPVSGVGSLNADLRLDLAQLAYKWWIGSGNDVFGIGAGAAYYHASLDGNVSGTLNGVAGTASESVSDNAFAPLLELGWRHSFSPSLRMYAEASGIKKNGGSVTGHIYGGTIGAEWYPSKNVALVADYGVSKIDLNHDGGTSTDVNIRLTGPSLYLKLRF